METKTLTKAEIEQVRNFYWLTGIGKKELAKLFKVQEEEIAQALNQQKRN